MKHVISGLAICVALLGSPAAWACGGLFCDNSQPVNQAAERILFARDGETLHMHVRITYQGPPSEFGWLVPTAPDVEVGVSSEQLFLDLDARFAPRFVLRTEIDDECDFGFAGMGGAGGAGGAGGDGGGGGEPNGGVQVLSREAVGPFDVATLAAESVEDLRSWLDENGYQIPEQTDALLNPYVEMGSAFVALKLLPDRESGDVSPLRLSFTGNRPAIPIVPTAVAAEADMGIIVHVLDRHRAVPLNYRHVVINEAAIDWQAGGSNYADVVSQAADEGDGRAFATDYAGPAGGAPSVYSEAQLQAATDAEDWRDLWDALDLWDAAFQPLDADLQRVLPIGLIVPEDPGFDAFLRCPDCYPAADIEIDGGALAAAIEAEINAPREALERLFATNRYLTRLYSTMSAVEMTMDPEFGVNPDLGDVPNRRNAVRRVRCVDDSPDFANAIIETDNGVRFRLVGGQNPNVIRRQAGETVRGMDVPGAQRVERSLEAGPSEVLVENEVGGVDEGAGGAGGDVPLGGQDGAGAADGGGSNDPVGCACDAHDGAPSPLWWLAALALVGWRRRRA